MDEKPQARPGLPVSVMLEMSRIAPKHFEFDRLAREPSVLFERSGLSEFHGSVWNSGRKEQINNAISSGKLQLVNHDLIEELSLTHSKFHAMLHDMGVRVPPAVIHLTMPDGRKTTALIGQQLPEDIPLWVKKVSFDEEGQHFGHRGAGISFVIPRSIKDITPSHDHEFYQQFVVPPDGYIRDIRVYVVGDKIIPGYIRRATKKLTRGNLSGLFIPDKEQFVTAEHPGKIEPLEGELKEKVVKEAQKVRRALIERIKRRRTDLAKQDVFGFGSIDFLLDANGEPIVSEFDVGPEIRNVNGLSDRLAKEVAEYLAKKAGKKRTIHVLVASRNEFNASMLSHLKKIFPDKRLVTKKPLLEVVYRL